MSIRLPIVVAVSAAAVLGAAYAGWRYASAPPAGSNGGALRAPAPSASAAAEPALAPLPPPPPPISNDPLRLTAEDGAIEIVLAADASATGAVAPAVEFDEDVAAITATLRSTRAQDTNVHLIFRRKANGVVAAADLAEGKAAVPARGQASFAAARPQGGWLPGEYEVEAAIDGIDPRTRPFRITSRFAPARTVLASEGLAGTNAALTGLGGRIASASFRADDERWSPDHLIDGFPFQVGMGGCNACGWLVDALKLPQEVVIALAGDAPLAVDRVVVDTDTENTTREDGWALVPRNVEVWLSSTSASDGFEMVAAAQIAPRAARQLVAFAPRTARYAKLRVLSNWGGPQLEIGEVRVLEPEGQESLDTPRNIALPSLGGVVARFSSQQSVENGVARLVDQRLDEPWSSEDAYLPQDLVFAFKDDQRALVWRVEVVTAGSDPGRWPKRVLVSTSDTSLFDFTDAGTLAVPKQAGTHGLEVNREARFVRLRVLENHGGETTALGEVRILEGHAPGYTSVVARTAALTGHPGMPGLSAGALARADVEEQEPNDQPASASRPGPGQSLGGRIEPAGETDLVAVDIPGPGRRPLTVGLWGEPYVRTSVSLVDPSGKELRRRDPTEAAAAFARFTWLVDPGPRLLRLTQPPASIVLIWDTSSSMDGRTDQLRDAVLSYLADVGPTERVRLVRFSDEVEVILDHFSSDPAELRAAASPERFYPFGGTRLRDAVKQAQGLLRDAAGNRAIVLMTDGEDSASEQSAPEFWTALRASGIRLYTIGLGATMKSLSPRAGTTGQRFLAHAALGAHGRAFFADEAAQLTGVYGRIAQEMRQVSRYVVRSSVGAANGRVTVEATGERLEAVSAPSRVLLVLDASGSMNRVRDGTRMIDTAKTVLMRLVGQLPKRIAVGLRVYGARVREGQPGACEDSRLVQPLETLDRERLAARIKAVSALGTTPIAYSIDRLADDLGDTPGEHMVVLVTDGKEECGGNPRAAVEALRARGVRLRLNIVGFALGEAAARQQLAEAAALTGGGYFSAEDDRGLQDAIAQAMAVPFELEDAAGTVVAGGQVGRGAVQAPEGVYTVVVHSATGSIRVPAVEVHASRDTRVALRKEGREVGIEVESP